ncbi:hypothetical protein ACET3Z_008017 [Daucus carota]
MPSGAKKRKAAKKKKVVQQSSSLSQGSDDAQHYDDKKSDGGSSSQDHHSSEHSFAEGDGKEVEKKESSSSGQSVVLEKSYPGGVNSGENVKMGDNIVQIEWELKSEEDYGSKEGSIESKEVHTGGSSSSSSSSSSGNSSRSSSDDESNVEKKTEVVETGQMVDSLSTVASQADTNISAGKTSSSVAETVPVVTPGTTSLTEEVVQVNGSASSGYPMTSDMVYKVEIQQNSDKGLPSSGDDTGISSVLMDSESWDKEDNTVSTPEENPSAYLGVKDSATEDKDEKLVLSFNAPNVHTSNGGDHIKESESPECSDSQPLVASAPQMISETLHRGA